MPMPRRNRRNGKTVVWVKEHDGSTGQPEHNGYIILDEDGNTIPFLKGYQDLDYLDNTHMDTIESIISILRNNNGFLPNMQILAKEVEYFPSPSPMVFSPDSLYESVGHGDSPFEHIPFVYIKDGKPHAVDVINAEFRVDEEIRIEIISTRREMEEYNEMEPGLEERERWLQEQLWDNI